LQDGAVLFEGFQEGFWMKSDEEVGKVVRMRWAEASRPGVPKRRRGGRKERERCERKAAHLKREKVLVEPGPASRESRVQAAISELAAAQEVEVQIRIQAALASQAGESDQAATAQAAAINAAAQLAAKHAATQTAAIQAAAQQAAENAAAQTAAIQAAIQQAAENAAAMQAAMQQAAENVAAQTAAVVAAMLLLKGKREVDEPAVEGFGEPDATDDTSEIRGSYIPPEPEEEWEDELEEELETAAHYLAKLLARRRFVSDLANSRVQEDLWDPEWQMTGSGDGWRWLDDCELDFEPGSRWPMPCTLAISVLQKLKHLQSLFEKAQTPVRLIVANGVLTLPPVAEYWTEVASLRSSAGVEPAWPDKAFGEEELAEEPSDESTQDELAGDTTSDDSESENETIEASEESEGDS
jgi:hypothetical protein